MWLLWSGRLRGREEGHVAECILSALCTWQMYFLLAGVPVGIHYLLLTGYGDLEELKSPLFFFFFLMCSMSVEKGSVDGGVSA